MAIPTIDMIQTGQNIVRLRKLAGVSVRNLFVAKSGLYHYLSTAKSNWHGIADGETVKYKKYFYVLRPLLACKWIVEKKAPPPMLFTDLAEAYLDGSIKSDVEKLLEIKMNHPEKEYGERFTGIDSYIVKTIKELDDVLKVLTSTEKNWDELNSVFLSLVKGDLNK